MQLMCQRDKRPWSANNSRTPSVHQVVAELTGRQPRVHHAKIVAIGGMEFASFIR